MTVHEKIIKDERQIISKQGAEVVVRNRSTGEEFSCINFCANNYLGLSSHDYVCQTSEDYIKSHGAGLSSVRFICGTQNIHLELEKKLAEFHGTDDAILYGKKFNSISTFIENYNLSCLF